MVLPDTYLDQDKPERMYAKAGLDAAAIVTKVFEALGSAQGAEAPEHWAECASRPQAIVTVSMPIPHRTGASNRAEEIEGVVTHRLNP
jgi:hypothetical protein